MSRSRRSKPRRSGVLGFGLDADDGHKRVTQGDDFLLLGGSHETHERMQDVVLRMRKHLKHTGRDFGDLSKKEFENLARESLES